MEKWAKRIGLAVVLLAGLFFLQPDVAQQWKQPPFIGGTWTGTVKLQIVDSDFGQEVGTIKLFLSVHDLDRKENWYQCYDGQTCMYISYVSDVQVFADNKMTKIESIGYVEYYPQGGIANLSFSVDGVAYNARVFVSPDTIKGTLSEERWYQDKEAPDTIDLIIGVVSLKKK